MKNKKTLINAALGILAAVLVVAGMVCMLSRFYIMDTERYEKYILTDEYYETIIAARDSAFDGFGSVIEADSAVLKTFFTDDVCKNLAAEYVRAVFYDMKNGTKTAGSVEASSKELREYLTQLFSEYDFTQSEHKTADAVVEAAYTLICGNVNSAVRFMPDKVMGALTELIAPFWSLVDGVVKFWYLFFLAALLLYAAMFFISGHARISGRLFGPAGSFWCACICIFFPVAVVYVGMAGVSLDLEKSALLYFLNGFLNSMRSGMFFVTLAFAVAATAALVAAGYFVTRTGRKTEDNGPILMRETE